MSAEVGRIHVRCAAPQGRGNEALALRGRLERTARTHLPDALEPVLAHRRERIFADRVSVTLDFDPSAYDDVTVAALWAGRVDAALAEGAREPGGIDSAEGVRRFASDREFDAAALSEVATSGRLSWVFAELGCGTGDVLVADALSALASTSSRRARAVAALIGAHAAVARGLYERLRPAEREESLAAFRRALGVAVETAAGRRREVPPRGQRLTRRAEAASGARRAPREPAGERGGPAALRRADRRRGEIGSVEEWRRAFALLADGIPLRTGPRLADEQEAAATEEHPARDSSRATEEAARSHEIDAELHTDPGETHADETGRPDREAPSGWWTRVAGLALLYPWLTEFLREPSPDVPPVAGRLWALAALADPGDESLVLDPLVRLLAGDDLERDTAVPPPPAGLEQLAVEADGVLASFSSALPGFAESSPPFVRAHFVARGGLIEPLAEGVRLVLEPAPLDPILELLPFPVESFRLPWSPPVLVRRREHDARA